MKTFRRLLAITLLAVTANNFVWFALTYWAYLSTKSVISTSTMGGIFMVLSIATAMWFGALVDHHRKKSVLIGCSLATLLLFGAGLALYYASPPEAFASVRSFRFWALIVILLSGTLAGSAFNIAIPTLVAFLVPEAERDKANGLFSSTLGLSMAITSVISGISLAYGGMPFVIICAMAATVLVLAALFAVKVEEDKPAAKAPEPGEGAKGQLDLRGTIQAVGAVPGLFALIFFTTFNNFLGGVFFALMDAYGLSLMSVEAWGFLWGLLSFGFILGGLYIAKKGLGSDPLRILFRNNLLIWATCIFFAIQPSILLLALGAFIWMFLFPFIEAVEQTIFQKVVPPERLGRVFGFAHSVEQSASPLTAFLIGPIAQWFFIPYMTTGRGVDLIGGWFGTGTGRGIALVFTFAGLVGVLVTLVAMRSKAYALLAERYKAG